MNSGFCGGMPANTSLVCVREYTLEERRPYVVQSRQVEFAELNSSKLFVASLFFVQKYSGL